MLQKSLAPTFGFVLFCVSVILAPQPITAMPGLNSPAAGNVIGNIASGEVIETMNASGYTYMLISENGKQSWVAIPETKVEKGSVVNYQEGMVMANFVSKSLNKTFETIIFSAGLATGQPGQATASPHQKGDDSFAAALQAEGSANKAVPVTAVGQEMSGGSAGAIVPFEELAVDKAAADNGYSVEEIFTKAEDLNGKKIQIKGKVVKFSPLIMGKNWVHLQDGTGNPMQNSHDLVVTTNDTVEVNAIVTLEGILSANKDFGAGYKYAAIVEEAVLVK